MKLPPRRRIIFWVRFWVIVFVVGNVFGAVIWHWTSKRDELAPQVVNLLADDPVLAAHLGDIYAHRVTGRLSYSGTESDPPYRRYHLYLLGSEGRGTVLVRVYPEAGGSTIDRWEVLDWWPE